MRASHFTFVMPYQPGTSSRSGRAVLGEQGLAVHLVDEQHLVAHRLVERKAPLVGLFLARPRCPGRGR